MGCFYSALNRVQVQNTFTSEEIRCLNQSWNILKTHDVIKFADEVLIRWVGNLSLGMGGNLSFRTIKQNSTFRRFWTSKLVIEGNNYDFGSGESCLRTDVSWHIGIREHYLIFSQLKSSSKKYSISSSIKQHHNHPTRLFNGRLLSNNLR